MNAIINNQVLSEGQCIVVRIAIDRMLSEVSNPEYTIGDDEHGKIMKRIYIERLQEVQQMVYK